MMAEATNRYILPMAHGTVLEHRVVSPESLPLHSSGNFWDNASPPTGLGLQSSLEGINGEDADPPASAT